MCASSTCWCPLLIPPGVHSIHADGFSNVPSSNMLGVLCSGHVQHNAQHLGILPTNSSVGMCVSTLAMLVAHQHMAPANGAPLAPPSHSLTHSITGSHTCWRPAWMWAAACCSRV